MPTDLNPDRAAQEAIARAQEAARAAEQARQQAEALRNGNGAR
jgi:hypothetical protein